ncbi:hypothetical protein JZO77_15350 [Enterococcus hulanensis]|uniref:hypothetical protein n=1 Tax=Enterococcus hulanensis TaxID=2559929 RepID=UPI001A90451E|nr:hypothetical protein [Enterococcus hulanensis]MBO0458111.1 hypothetical protein [Enterococcus hulanensis]
MNQVPVKEKNCRSPKISERRRNELIKILYKASLSLLAVNVAVIVLPFVVLWLFPESIFVLVGWIFPLIGVTVFPFTLIFFFLTLFLSTRKERSLKNELTLQDDDNWDSF